jgi:hypothetical protein
VRAAANCAGPRTNAVFVCGIPLKRRRLAARVSDSKYLETKENAAVAALWAAAVAMPRALDNREGMARKRLSEGGR